MTIQIENLQEWRQPFQWDQEVKHQLNTIFGKKTFLDKQQEIVNMILSNKDVFVCMPTGYGKSLTFQLPALISKGCTLVIMPTISLIFDQVTMLRALGLEVDSTLQNESLDQISYKVTNGLINILLTTPEKINSPVFKSLLETWIMANKIARFVIDEAHCVSKWGRDFRPSYVGLGYLKGSYPRIPIVALSATVTSEIRADVTTILKIPQCIYVKGSFNRRNLFYEVRRRDTKTSIEEVHSFITSKFKDKSGIIYCLTRISCEEVARDLRQLGIHSACYHAGMSPEDRATTQLEWMLDDIQVIVATVAFGMGINKPEVRFVIHYQMPENLESYIQESGRAGRDGEIGHCMILYHPQDYQTHAFLMNKSQSQESTDYQNQKLAQMQSYCLGTSQCRRQLLLEYMEEKFDPIDCNNGCDVCLKSNEKGGEIQDMSNEVKLIMEQVRTLNITRIQLIALLKGQVVNAVPQKLNKFQQSSMNGLMNSKKDIVEQLVDDLIGKGFLTQQQVQIQGDGYNTAYSILKSDAKKLYQMKIYELTTYKQVIPFQSVDLKTQILKQRADQNFSQYLKKPPKEESTDLVPNNIFAVHKQESQYQILKIMAEPHELINKMMVMKKEKLYHPVYGYCSELQFLTLDEKLRTLRKEIYKKSDGLGLIEAIIQNQSIAELVRKLPMNKEELLSEDIYIPFHLKHMPYMLSFLDIVNEFTKLEKIDKNLYYVLQEIDILKEDQIYDKVEEEKTQKKQPEKQEQPAQIKVNYLDQVQMKLKNKKINFI